MKIRTPSAAATHALATYLRRCGCVVGVVDDRTLEGGVRPGSLSDDHARVELEGYLRVWEAMNDDVRVERPRSEVTA
jgi:hypothetical protein